MKNIIYSYAYKLHFSWISKIALSIIFYLFLQSMLLCHNICADHDPRTLYEQMNGGGEEIRYSYPNGHTLIVHADGRQVLNLGDGVEISKDLDGIVEVKAEGYHARFKDTYMAVATKMQGPFSWTEISDTSSETSDTSSETSESSSDEELDSVMQDQNDKVSIPTNPQIIEHFINIARNGNITTKTELAHQCLNWVKTNFPDNYWPQTKEDFETCEITQVVDQIKEHLVVNEDHLPKNIAIHLFRNAVGSYAALRVHDMANDQTLLELTFLKLLGDIYDLDRMSYH